MSVKKNYTSAKTIVQGRVKLDPPVRTYGEVKIKDGCSVGRYTFINDRTSIYKNSTIGSFCSIGKQCELGALSHPVDWLSTSPIQYNRAHFPAPNGQKIRRFDRPLGVTIGHDVWIGSMALIKSGVTVGIGAIVAGGSVVTKDVPPYAIVGGVPAKIIRYRFSPEPIERLLSSEWWNRPIEEIYSLPFDDIEEVLAVLEGTKQLPAVDHKAARLTYEERIPQPLR